MEVHYGGNVSTSVEHTEMPGRKYEEIKAIHITISLKHS
jgi:hypothetical protein